jgi:hypothetical protein
LPTRVDFVKGDSPDSTPSWLDDSEDDQPADLSSVAVTDVEADSVPAPAAEEAGRAGEGVGPAGAGAGDARSGDADRDDAAPSEESSAEESSSEESSSEASPDADVTAADRLASDRATGDIAAKDAEDIAAADRPTEDAVAGDRDDVTVVAPETPSVDAAAAAGAPDPAELTDQAIELPDPEPDALSPVDAEPGGDTAPADGDADVDGPGDDDGTGVGKRLSGTEQVAVVPGVPRYHVSDCILIRFMDDEDVQRMTAEEAEKAGCTPCSACQPED